ncbi:MAG TPA: hypothetical protein VGG79_25665 [Roseiarcus sp.]|jgi:hypothetical protein
MRISLATRATRVCAAATLVFSLGLAPAFARMGGGPVGAHFARPAFGGGHFPRIAPRGFNPSFGLNRFGFSRFGPSGPGRFDANRFSRFGFNRFDRFGRFGRNQLLLGGWGGWGWGGVPASAGASEPIIVGDSAPVIINVGADPAPGPAAAGYGGACVIHKLIYDSSGKYAGERQSPQC